MIGRASIRWPGIVLAALIQFVSLFAAEPVFEKINLVEETKDGFTTLARFNLEWLTEGLAFLK